MFGEWPRLETRDEDSRCWGEGLLYIWCQRLWAFWLRIVDGVCRGLALVQASLFSMVLKTGPDQPVRPVEPSTGELSGSVRFNGPFVVEPVLNRSNRRLDRRTGPTVRFFANRLHLKNNILFTK